MYIPQKLLEHFPLGLHSGIKNYVLPGLYSYLLGDKNLDGSITRVFYSSRLTQEFISPHNHRYNFICEVLDGYVENTIYEPTFSSNEVGDFWQQVVSIYSDIGIYKTNYLSGPVKYIPKSVTYRKGEIYKSDLHTIHSIKFSKGSVVLFREGKKLSEQNVALIPYCKETETAINNFNTHPWMFEKL